MTTTKSGMTDLLWVMAQGHACPIANERYAWAVAEITGLRQKVAQLIDEASYADLRASGGITGDVAQPQEATETLAGIIASIPADLNWLIGKGKTRPDEPPFGVQLLRGLKIVAETEGDDICETIKAALALTRPHRGSALP